MRGSGDVFHTEELASVGVGVNIQFLIWFHCVQMCIDLVFFIHHIKISPLSPLKKAGGSAYATGLKHKDGRVLHFCERYQTYAALGALS